MTFSEIKNKLQNYTIGIAGAGGLGSNCAVSLARTGIGKLVIADFDTIDESNLNRQYYFYNQIGEKKVYALKENIRNINPATEIIIHDIKLTEDNIPKIFSNCDIIIEAFDIAEMKKILIETILSEMKQTPVISGSGMAGWGENNTLHSRQLENLYICGDEKSEVSKTNPPLAPRVAIVANMQANLVLEILLKNE